MQLAQIANQVFALLAVAAQITVVLLLFVLCIRTKLTKKIVKFLGKHALLLTFIIALTASLGSLLYSEIIAYVPCKLCWYQRIFLFPQVFLLGMAFWKKDRHIADYSILLSSIGAGIGLYHYLIQRGVIGEILPCSVGAVSPCAQTPIMAYGYITIPLMALSMFLLILVLMIMRKKY